MERRLSLCRGRCNLKSRHSGIEQFDIICLWLTFSFPTPERRRALLVVDMQSGFLNEQDNWVIAPIQKLLREGEYSLVVEANFYADENSIWKKQHDWTFAP